MEIDIIFIYVIIITSAVFETSVLKVPIWMLEVNKMSAVSRCMMINFTDHIFYHWPEHRDCYRVSQWMLALCVMKLVLL